MAGNGASQSGLLTAEGRHPYSEVPATNPFFEYPKIPLWSPTRSVARRRRPPAAASSTVSLWKQERAGHREGVLVTGLHLFVRAVAQGMMSQYLSDSIVAADRSVAAVLSYERAPSRAQSTAEKVRPSSSCSGTVCSWSMVGLTIVVACTRECRHAKCYLGRVLKHACALFMTNIPLPHNSPRCCCIVVKCLPRRQGVPPEASVRRAHRFRAHHPARERHAPTHRCLPMLDKPEHRFPMAIRPVQTPIQSAKASQRCTRPLKSHPLAGVWMCDGPSPNAHVQGAPGRSEDAMWKGPTSEAGSGYSYPETAVTSRIAESISETELNFFMSKIATLEEEVCSRCC